ncbi:thiamine transporter 1-like [Anthonomus grandis grandis]|uniref:thiamine transporter 1-like n=1 Tax=Anthonomus grandis grandis TaxID=2921223 RepID=UPI002165912E|nr:thiamine transporter 1-like [Anthonomus grandis grandis]XP_050308769.1 thiamine transporter 1-like [Anthonomus grandis grandis]
MKIFKKCPNTTDHWIIISLLVSVFGFLKEFRPSEPFIYEFLTGGWKNVTQDQVMQEVYPVGTYSYLALLIVVFLATDICRYRVLIVLLAASGVVVWGLLLWTTDLFELQIGQVFFGVFAACEVAYFTYIYAKVDKEYIQQVTSHTRAAILAGRAFSSILGQVLISFNAMNFYELNYITFSAMIAATIWSLFLPPVKKSIYFHKDVSQKTFAEKSRAAFSLIWYHLRDGYSNKYLIKWSVWWALSTTGFIQVQIYMQTLWQDIVNDPSVSIYNGAVESILTVIGFLGALAAGALKVDWKTRGELALTCCSLMQGFAMLISSQTSHVMVSYACYIVFGALYHLTITVASSEIAKVIQEDSYGLIFGINTFVALLIQAILTVLVVSDGVGFALPPRQQYFVYGVFHVVLGFIYIVVGLTSWLISKRDYRRASCVPDPPARSVIIY